MKLLKITNKIIIFLSTIIIFITISYLYQVLIQKKDYGTILGYTFFKVATGSMEPTIKTGDTVLVKLTNAVKNDDIVVYINNDNYVCHRIIKIEENKVVCKGDNNNIEDEDISLDSIIGKIIYII